MDEFKCKLFERCKSEDKLEQSLLAKKECVKDFCQEPDNTDNFECLALECKENYQLPIQKLNCIKQACDSNGDRQICQKISACQKENSVGLLGPIKVFKCLKNSVFDGIDFE